MAVAGRRSVRVEGVDFSYFGAVGALKGHFDDPGEVVDHGDVIAWLKCVVVVLNHGGESGAVRADDDVLVGVLLEGEGERGDVSGLDFVEGFAVGESVVVILCLLVKDGGKGDASFSTIAVGATFAEFFVGFDGQSVRFCEVGNGVVSAFVGAGQDGVDVLVV